MNRNELITRREELLDETYLLAKKHRRQGKEGDLEGQAITMDSYYAAKARLEQINIRLGRKASDTTRHNIR